MKVIPFYPNGYFGSVCYVLQLCEKYVVIDPSVSADEIINVIPNFSPSYIILTHAHFDHMLFLDNMHERFPEAPVLLNENDANGFLSPYYNASILFTSKALTYAGVYTEVKDGDELWIDSIRLRFYRFSGHTEGSMIIECEGALFVGDLIFEGGNWGRVDLISGNYDKMTRSITNFFNLFDKEYTIYPGHGSAFSYIQAKRNFNH